MGRHECGPCRIPAHAHVRYVAARVLFRYGLVVGKHPWPFVLVPFLTFSALGAGMVTMVTYDGSLEDDAYLPHNSQSYKDRALVASLFQDRSRDHYDALELNEEQIMGTLIFRARNNGSIYDSDVLVEIRQVLEDVKSRVTASAVDVTSGEKRNYSYSDLCGRRRGGCVVTGERLLTPQFDNMRHMNIMTYPKWKIPNTDNIVDLSFALANADRYIKRVGVIRVTFKLRHDLKPLAFAWEDAFVEHMKKVKVNQSDIFFSASRSVRKELDRSFYNNIIWIWICLGVIAFMTCFVMTGGNAISTRLFFALLVLVTPALGLVSSMGVVSLCGVWVVEMVWTNPLLVTVVGMTNTWLLLIRWRHLQSSDACSVPQHLGLCLANAGTSISIASLAVTTVMCATYAVSFPCIANMALFAGVGVLFTYLSTITFTVGCLALSGQRVVSSRHNLASQITSPPDQLGKNRHSKCCVIEYAGAVPEKSNSDQGWLERGPRTVLVHLTQSLSAKVVMCLLYLALLASAIYGILHMHSDLDVKDMVEPESFANHYLHMDSKYYGFSFPVVFVATRDTVYSQATLDSMSRLLAIAQRDPSIEDDFVRCWMTDFNKSDHRANFTLQKSLKSQAAPSVGFPAVSNQTDPTAANLSELGTEPPRTSPMSTLMTDLPLPNATDGVTLASVTTVVYNEDKNFPFTMSVLKSFVDSSDEYQGDVVWDNNKEKIIASRCYIFSKKLSKLDEMTGLMERMRALARGSGIPVFAYHPSFLNYDQSLAFIPTLYQVAGVAVGVSFLFFSLFYPEAIAVLVATVTNTVTAIVTLMGYTAFTAVPLSIISMPSLVQGIGLAVYFSSPIAAAYLQSLNSQRMTRAADAMSRAGVPLFTGGVVVLVGLLTLLLATSYAIFTFYKVISITVVVSVFLSVMVTPAILSWVGSEKSQQEKDHDDKLRAELLKQNGKAESKSMPNVNSLDESFNIIQQQHKIINAVTRSKSKGQDVTQESTEKIHLNDPSCVYCTEREYKKYLVQVQEQTKEESKIAGAAKLHEMSSDYSSISCLKETTPEKDEHEADMMLNQAPKQCKSNANYENLKHLDPLCAYCTFTLTKAPFLQQNRSSSPQYENLHNHADISMYRQHDEIYDNPINNMPKISIDPTSDHQDRIYTAAAAMNTYSSWAEKPALMINGSGQQNSREPEYVNLNDVYQQQQTCQSDRMAHMPMNLTKLLPRRISPSADFLWGNPKKMEDAQVPFQGKIASSTENIYQVTSTLSDKGYLGGSQQYVSQNLLNIPA